MPPPTKTIKATELYYNKKDIDLLLNVDTTREDYPKDEDLYMRTDELTKLRNILRGAKYDVGEGCYKKTIVFKKKKYGDIEYGRLYPDNKKTATGQTITVYSIQSRWKLVRQTVFDNHIIGFDLINSQPSVLLQLCNKYAPNDKFEYLEKYVSTRDTIRQELMDYYKLPKRTIKNIMIGMCFGQELKNIYKKYSITSHDFLDGFYKDTTKIKKITCHKFPDFHKAEQVYDHRKAEGTLKKYNTIENSSIAMYLQNIEGDIMLTIYDALKKEDLTVATVIHDEICFRNNDYIKNNKEAIMCKMEETIKSKMDFDVKFHSETYKKDDEFVKRHTEFQKIEEEIEDIGDDVRNGKRLFEALKDKVNSSSLQGEFMYDDERGLWVHEEKKIKRIVYRLSDILYSTKMNKDEKLVKRNWRDLGSMYKNIMEFFWSLVDDTEELNPDKNKGYLLFKNGVLDCYNFKMLPFSPEYNFTKRINRNFDINKDYSEDKKLICEKIFETAYTDGGGNTERMDYFMELLSIAIMEGGVDKRYLTMLGETNSGKGVLTSLLRKSFDEFITTFNTSVLLQGENSNLEDASKWRFLTKCYDGRIMIGNEIAIQSQDTTNAFGHKKRTEKGLNVAMLKTIVSGGDSVEARRLRENEISIINRSFVLMLANDMPKTKADEALADRTLILEGSRSSTVKETYDEKLFFKADPSIKDWITKVETRDAFVALMCQVYKQKKNNRTAVPDWIINKVQEFVEVNSSLQWVKDNYEVYNGDIMRDFDAVKGKQYYTVDWNKVNNCCVRADVMYDLYKDGGGMDSIAKFGSMLTNNGIILCRKKIKGSQFSYRVGISMLKDDINDKLNFRSDDEDDDSDCDNDIPDPKKPHNYPPMKPYKAPEPEPKRDVKQKTIFEMAFQNKAD